MKLATFQAPDRVEPLAGEVVDDRVVAFAGRRQRGRRPRRRGRRAERRGRLVAAGRGAAAGAVPRPGTIYAIGLNYAEHIAETGAERPEQPIVFVKVAGSVAPPGRPDPLPGGGAPARLRGRADDRDRRRRRDRRLLRRRRRQRARPPGPRAPVDPGQGRRHVLPVRPLGHDRRRGRRIPATCRLRTWVNGELRQDSRTSDLIFGCQELVDFIARPARWLPVT